MSRKRKSVLWQIVDNRKRRTALLWAAGLALFALLFYGVADRLAKSLTDQSMAMRWSKNRGAAQISCFFSQGAQTTREDLEEFAHALDAYLLENSIEQTSSNPGARLWVEAYSAEGKITLSNGKTNVEADALGVGGDFFLFHPQKLLYGGYFSGNDLNQDYCVIDQDAAWQLFGSNEVAGMTVTIDGIPHIVSGVIERPGGRLLRAAGLDTTRVYVSYDTLAAYGTSYGINHYEILMPNPVKQFAYQYVKDKLGADEKETEVVENTTRFSLLNRFKRLKQFGTRAMNGKAISYPYWENLARGYEDIVGALTLCSLLCLVYPFLYLIWAIVFWKRHKGWTIRDIWGKIRDRYDARIARQYYAKQKK